MTLKSPERSRSLATMSANVPASRSAPLVDLSGETAIGKLVAPGPTMVPRTCAPTSAPVPKVDHASTTPMAQRRMHLFIAPPSLLASSLLQIRRTELELD